MVFACQADSYRTDLRTKVVSCAEVVQKKGEPCYHVVLEDTVLFPEGGGQPDDRGTVNGLEVKQVFRDGAKAVHVLDSPLPEGADVELKVDWRRRFDHMQQHSAQHLLSAIADERYNFKTVSWELGKSRSCIDFDASKISQEQVQLIEDEANDQIRNNLPVIVHTYESKDSPELDKVRTRGLPDDHVGSVRIVEIQGVEANMCCGTHVRNLSHLQAIKLLHTETNRGGTRLFFIAGSRVLDYCQRSFATERSLSKILSCGADEHVDAVDKLQKSVKSLNKVSRSHLKEIVQLEVEKLISSHDGAQYLYIHRDEGDVEYMNSMVNGLATLKILVLVTVGSDTGQFLLAGEESIVSELGPRISSLLDGKGGGKKGRFQGKANNMKAKKQLDGILKEFFKTNS